MPALAYYLWGTFVEGFLRGHTESSLKPHLSFTNGFWLGWLRMAASVITYPIAGLTPRISLLIALGLAAITVSSLRISRTGGHGVPLLIGLWLGYLTFGLVHRAHQHASLLLAPTRPDPRTVVAPAATYAVERLRIAPPAAKAVAVVGCCALIAAATLKVVQRLRDPIYSEQVDVYQRAGIASGHTSAGVHIDPSFDTPLLYYGWIGSSPLYYPDGSIQPGEIERSLQSIAREVGPPRLLVVTAMYELDRQPELRAFVNGLPVQGRGSGYIVFRLPRGAT